MTPETATKSIMASGWSITKATPSFQNQSLLSPDWRIATLFASLYVHSQTPNNQAKTTLHAM